MNDFIKTILVMLSGAIGPAITMMVFGTLVWHVVYNRVHRDEKKFSLFQLAPIALLFGYLGILIDITLVSRTTGDSSVQWHLFRAFWEAWNAFTLRSWLNPLLNVAMFIPLGSLLPLVAKIFRRWYVTLTAGFGCSLLIEIIQYALVLGSADVDDLFCNTLGTMLGFCMCMIVLCLIEKRRTCVAYAALPVLVSAVLVGTFASYCTQPYGNLADGPSFAANTSKVRWYVDCVLSSEAGATDIYQIEPFDRDACVAFGESFTQGIGKVIENIYYYDDEVWFSNPVTTYGGNEGFQLIVSLMNRTYSYSESMEYLSNHSYGKLSEVELYTALLDFGIEIPEDVMLTYDNEGWYTVQANQITNGETMVDGTLRCQVMEGGVVAKIDNLMSTYTFVANEPIISEIEAYDRLCQGKFSKGQWFEFYDPQEVHVTSCKLQYLTDSKGFRQPVYLFEMDGLNSVFVPALAN